MRKIQEFSFRFLLLRQREYITHGDSEWKVYQVGGVKVWDDEGHPVNLFLTQTGLSNGTWQGLNNRWQR